ncbi:hypothetical protein DFH28DRAFT_910343 [Melampsora americana]|nr:hypothetical protein DFH28DRAFT_910343 [Melampsora americana]
MCTDVLAHSDDEAVPGKPYRTIKTLPYRSKNVNKFIRRLDVEIKKAALIAGETIRRAERRLPVVPQPSIFTKVPVNQSIDFYNPLWFKSLNPGQRRLIPNSNKVTFLPDASQSLLPKPHPDELLSDKAFNAKYLDILSEPYRVDGDSDSEDESNTDSSEGSENLDTAEILTDGNESEFYSEGDYGDLYDDEVDVDEGEGVDDDDSMDI